MRVTLSLGSRSPSLRSVSPLQDGPWINNKARRVWRTRWRGSLVWGRRAHRANRVIANHRNLLLPQTSSRCAEETIHLYTHTHSAVAFFTHHVLFGASLHLCVFQELQPDCGLSNRIRMMNHVCELAKTKKFEEVSLLGVSHCDTAIHAIFCVY